MNDQTTSDASGMQPAGIDLTAPPVMSDIKATAGELLQHVEDVALSTEHSTWLENARSALASAVQCIEQHFAAFEARLMADVAAVKAKAADVEDKAKGEVVAVEDKAKSEAATVETDAKDDIAAVAAAATGVI